MKKWVRYVSAIAAVQLAACSAEPATQPQTEPVANKTFAPVSDRQQQSEKLVLALGDSLYAGYGLDPSQSVPAVLERELKERGIGARVVNAGVSGDTSAGGLRRLAFTLEGLDRAPDLAIVGLGANDVLRGLDPAETRRNLDAILAELKRRNIPVMLTGMLAPRNLGGPYVRSFERIYPELASKYGATLDPFFLNGVITRPALLLPDGIHPNSDGIERIVDRLSPVVAERLERSKS